MITPTVQLRATAGIDDAIVFFRTQASNAYGAIPPGSMTTAEKREAFVRWSVNVQRAASSYIAWETIDAIFDSPRYRDIGSMQPAAHVEILINAELARLSSRFGEVADELEHARDFFTGPGAFVAPDTSFYIEHPDKLEEVDFRPLLNIREQPVRVVVPIIVVDELDNLKRSKDRDVRWRAAYSLAVIDRVVQNPSRRGQLALEDFSAIDNQTGGIPRGEVTLQLVLDPPGHSRLPIPDDEFVDRCRVCQTFTGSLTVLTYDTGQSMRARMAGLQVNKLVAEPEPTPKDTSR
jgi:hypothetical protein